ncbi:MAG: hypothetical protein P8078_01010 [bacterium]
MEKFKHKVVLMSLIVFFQAVLIPQVLEAKDENNSLTHNAELRYFMLNKYQYAGNDHLIFDKNSANPAPKRKIPAIGILLSGAVPGTGEIYAGSAIKGAVFLGFEIFLWWRYADFRKKGFDIEEKYEAFADANWDKEEWRDWMQQHPEFGDTTHTLPATKPQQYYEMIGKYDQFKAGWDDYYEGGPDVTEHRDRYMTMRLNSNNEFAKASTCAMLTLANHVFSALDAAWTIRGVNRKIETQARMSYRNVNGYDVPFLSLITRW